MTEIKAGIVQSSPEERLYLAAFVKHLARNDDPSYQAELTELNQQIDDGKKYSLAQVKRLHEYLRLRVCEGGLAVCSQ